MHIITRIRLTIHVFLKEVYNLSISLANEYRLLSSTQLNFTTFSVIYNFKKQKMVPPFYDMSRVSILN